MGSGQSVRATHFSRPEAPPSDQEAPHISISNKMVERLVEDATLAGGAAAAAPTRKPRDDLKDKILTEKIKCLDETHSERSKITVDDLSSLARRIELRSSYLPDVDAVCADFQQRVIDCYNEGEEAGDVVQCWNTIGEFSACVAAASAARLQAHTRHAAAAQARRERGVALARLDLGASPADRFEKLFEDGGLTLLCAPAPAWYLRRTAWRENPMVLGPIRQLAIAGVGVGRPFIVIKPRTQDITRYL